MAYDNERDGTVNPGLIMGIVIVAIGALLLLDNLGIFYGRYLWRYWPVLVIAVGFVRLLESRSSAGRLWGGIIVTAGGLLLADNLGFINANFNVVWPLIIVGIGLTLLLRTIERQQYPERDLASTSTLNELAVFGGGKRRVTSQDFKGGEILAVFAGSEIDLREASLASEAVVDATAIFGGVEVRVPADWTVSMQGTFIFGGYEDKTVSRPEELNGSAKRLVVKGVAVFGSVTVEN